MAKVIAPKNDAPKKANSTRSFTDRLQAHFKDEHTVTLDNIDNFGSEANWLSTGSPSLDYHLNTWGYPAGIIEVRGLSKSGKTTLSLHAMKVAALMNPDAIIVILSTERRDNKPYAKQIGVPTNRVLVHQVVTIEQVFNKVQQTITHVEKLWKEEEREGKPKYLFVWDSLGASIAEQERKKMSTAAEKDEVDHANAAMAAAAKAVKRGLRYIVGLVYDLDICFYIINHSYDKIGSFVGGQESYGGKAIQYMPTMRLEASYTGKVKVAEVEVGQTTMIKVIKSDYTSNTDKHEIEIGYGLGLIITEADIAFGLADGYLVKEGKAGYSFMNGKLKWSTRKQLYQLYLDRDKFLQLLVKRLIRSAHEKMYNQRKVKMDED